MMKISVIIPAYNCANTIRNTVESVLKSGLSDLEILIIDDGATDETPLICTELENEYPCLRSIHQKNAGVSAARNRGIREATGDYIWFVDADDSIKEGSLLRAEEILQMQSPDMLVFGIDFVYSHKGIVYRTDELLPPLEGMASSADCSSMMYELFKRNSLSALWNRIIKRTVILGMDTLLREDMFLYEDLEYVLRLWKHCNSFYFFREAVYLYRQSEDEGNAGRRLTRIAHIPDLVSKIEAVLEGPDKDRILLTLYMTLAREKIGISSAKGINTICCDFHNWINAHKLLYAISEKAYPMMIYQRQTFKLIVKRTQSMLRHKTANLIKRTVGDFRKR